MRNRPRLTPGRWRAVVYAVLVHVAIVAALVVGFRWNQSPPAIAPGKPIDAVVAEDPQKKKLEENRRRAEEQKQREEAARNQAEAEKKRQEQEARKRDDEQRRMEAERQRQAEAEKKQQTELKRQQEEENRRAEEKKRREEEVRKQADAEKKRQEETRKQLEAERRRKAAEESLKQQLVAEEEVRAEAARAGRAATEMDKYREAIRQRVSNRWNEPSNVPRGLKCLVRVRFVPGTWDIVEVVIVRGSGNKIFDDSVERAVLAASPLPLPSNSELHKYFGELQFEFEPRGK